MSPTRKSPRRTVSPRQAAWLSGQSQRTVDKTIERGELPARAGTRQLDAADVVYLAVRKDLAETLTAQGKKDLHTALAKMQSLNIRDSRSADLEVELAGGTIVVDVKAAYSRVVRRWKVMERAEREIVSEPGIRAGEPVIRGTRIPVYMIGDLSAQGADAAEILEDYPALNQQKLDAAFAYVATHPKRGRPRVSWNERKKKTARSWK